MAKKRNSKNEITNSLLALASVICDEKRYTTEEANSMGHYSAKQIAESGGCGVKIRAIRDRLSMLEESGLVDIVIAYSKNAPAKFYKLKKSS